MRKPASICLRMIFLSTAMVVILGGNSAYAQTATKEITYRTTYDRQPTFTGHETMPGSSSASHDQRVTNALERAWAAQQASPPRYEDAEHAYRFAIYADPNDSRGYFGLGYVLGAQKRYADAVEAYRKAIAVDPKSSEAHFNLGLMYARLRNKEQAVKQVRVLENLKSEWAPMLMKSIDQIIVSFR